MKYLKLILIFLVINSCKGQTDITDLKTTWYEIKKQGDKYSIIDCGYEGEWFRIKNDSIFEHGVMEDSSFKVHDITKGDNLVSLYISEKEKYDISWIDKEKGIIKKTSNIDGSIAKYYVNESHLNKINKVKGSSKDCISSEDFDIDKSKSAENNNYFINGTWNVNCENPIGITIKDNELIMTVEPNQYYIHLIKINDKTEKNVTKYKLKIIRRTRFKGCIFRSLF